MSFPFPQVEQTHGEKAVEAHILRRIFATIRIKDWETDELTTTLVVAYHQDGIQAAIGPCVLICHNQCILSPERSVCNYGKKKVSTEEVFETVDGWLANFEVNMNEDIERIQRLKRRVISMEEIYMYTAQDVRFHGFFAMCLFHLRKDAYSRLRLVPVLGREDFLHLIVEIVFLADVHHAPDDLVMVDTLHRVVVDVVFLVGTLKRLEVHHFNSVFLEVKLLLSFHYCQCRFHNLEFYEVNTVVCLLSGVYLPSVERL